jgi:hypothetical protein
MNVFIFIIMLIFFSNMNEIAGVNSYNHIFIWHYKQLTYAVFRFSQI